MPDETRPVGDRQEPLVPPPGPFGVLNPSYRLKRRQQRILAELEHSRRGDHTVPTWVLALILLLLVGGWITFIALS